MHSKRAMIPVVLLILVVIGGGGWFIWQQTRPVEETALQGSGTVEAVEVNISSEVSGRVVEVLVEQGQVVQAGDVLPSQILLQPGAHLRGTAVDEKALAIELEQDAVSLAYIDEMGRKVLSG